MNLPAAWLAEVATVVLATSRLGGMVVTAPFPGNHVPSQVKIGLVLVLAWVAMGTMPTTHLDLSLDLHLVGLAVSEVALGLLVGITFRITFSCAEMMGASFSQSLGLTQGHVFDPMLESDDGVPGRIATMLAMLLVFSLGAHRIAIAYLLQSFHALPVGQAFSVTAATPPECGSGCRSRASRSRCRSRSRWSRAPRRRSRSSRSASRSRWGPGSWPSWRAWMTA